MSPFVTGFCWTWFRWSSVWVREDFSPKQLALWWSVLIIVAQGFFDSHVSQESKDQTTVTSNWFIGLPNIRRSICNPAAFYGHAVLEHMALLTQVGRAVLSHACSIVFHPQSNIYIYLCSTQAYAKDFLGLLLLYHAFLFPSAVEEAWLAKQNVRCSTHLPVMRGNSGWI